MNLISCKNCGVVLDADQIIFPEAYDLEGNANENSEWNGQNYISTVDCPVCKAKIRKPSRIK